MDDRLNLNNLGWGAAFSILGLALLTEAIGWWEMSDLNLAIAGPLLLIVVGMVILASSLASGARRR